MSRQARFRCGLDKLRNAIAIVVRLNEPKTRCTLPHAPASTSSIEPWNNFFIDNDSSNGSGFEQDVAMGKSNKFDYTNKNSSGVKCGAFIRSNLEKEADKVVKDAEKQASKCRKANSSSAASSADLSETQDAIFHTLDIKIPGKLLGNEGAFEVAQGLYNALRRGTSEAAVLLEDLNLTGNALTTKSLARLAPIIRLAQHDLKTLNLSNNAIRVQTTQEAQEWETFLRAFEGCYKLRRLDFSGNTSLGVKALEVLAAVHIKEEPIDPSSVYGDASVVSLGDHHDFDCSDQPTPKTAEFEHMDPMVTGKLLKRRCGLRSIPCISLNDIGLTDGGALWLSYVIADHHLPSQLIDALNATAPSTSINAYQQEAHSRGVDWNEREHTLGKDGLHLLLKAESFRQQAMLADQVTVASSMLVEGAEGDIERPDAELPARRSTDRRHSRAARGDRRISIRSIRSIDADQESNEMHGARKRLQRSVIEKLGAENIELWKAGLQIFSSTRVLLRIGPESRDQLKIYTGPAMFDFSTRHNRSKRSPVSRPVTPANRSENVRPVAPVHHARAWKGSVSLKQGTYAAILTAETNATAGEPELVITEVTNSPSTPKRVFKPHRKDAFSQGGDVQAVTHKPSASRSGDTNVVSQKLDALIVRDDNPLRFVTWQEQRMSEDADAPNSYRDSRKPSHFPDKVVRCIVEHMLTPRENGLLSAKQYQTATAWALDLANVDVEKEWRKEAKSAQIWRLLENMGCLEYE